MPKRLTFRRYIKKDTRTLKKNYRPISILNVFSKISERYVETKIKPFIDTCLSSLISAYHKNYSSTHVLIRLIEEWKKQLDKGKFVGAVLMDRVQRVKVGPSWIHKTVDVSSRRE